MSRKKVISYLVSTADTGYFINIWRKKSDKRKLEIIKFDPKAKKRIKFIEKKRL